jgi:hypothetical protein
MNRFFTGNQSSSSGLESKLDELKQKWFENKTGLEKSKAKQKELFDFTELVTKGYITNLNIIIDISKIMLEYKSFIEEISSTMEAINTDIKSSPVNNEDFKRLKALTNTNVDKITNFFNGELENMQKILSNRGDSETVQNVQNISSTFKSINYNNSRLENA